MKSSFLKRVSIILLSLSIFCVLFATGSYSRKRVEIEKNKTLDEKIKKLTKANTVITTNLKLTKNTVSDYNNTIKALKRSLKESEKKYALLEENFEAIKENYKKTSQKLNELKKVNYALGEELTSLKEKELSLKIKIQKLQGTYKEASPLKKDALRKNKKTSDSNNSGIFSPKKSKSNFGW